MLDRIPERITSQRFMVLGRATHHLMTVASILGRLRSENVDDDVMPMLRAFVSNSMPMLYTSGENRETILVFRQELFELAENHSNETVRRLASDAINVIDEQLLNLPIFETGTIRIESPVAQPIARIAEDLAPPAVQPFYPTSNPFQLGQTVAASPKVLASEAPTEAKAIIPGGTALLGGAVGKVQSGRIYGGSVIGGNRTNNEDIIIVLQLPDGRRLMLICDGMGAHENGERAAEIVGRAFYSAFVVMAMDLCASTLLADKAMQLDNAEHGLLGEHGCPGTTVVAVLLDTNNVAQIVHVGDSRLYLVKKNRQNIGLLTRDHTVGNIIMAREEHAAEMAKYGPILWDGQIAAFEQYVESQVNPAACSVLARTVGVESFPCEPEVSGPWQLDPGDMLVEISDGMLRQAEAAGRRFEDDLRYAAQNYGDNPEGMVDYLLWLAQNSSDNSTVGLTIV